MYCKANGCIERPYRTVDGFFDAWNEVELPERVAVAALGLIPASFAACVIIIHIVWVFVRDLVQENVDLGFLLDDEAEDVSAMSSTSVAKNKSSMIKDIFTPTVEPQDIHASHRVMDTTSSQVTQTPAAVTLASPTTMINGPSSQWRPDANPAAASYTATVPSHPASAIQGGTSTIFTGAAHSGVSGHSGHVGLHSSVSPESRSTTIEMGSGSLLRTRTDSQSCRADSPEWWRTESGRKNPVPGLTSTPPPRSPDRRLSTARELATVSKVDRGCSPVRCYDVTLRGPHGQYEVSANTWRLSPRRSPDWSKCSFTASALTGSGPKYEDRVRLGSVGVRSATERRRFTSPGLALRRSIDCRRQLLEQERYLRVLKSNRTLEKFMDVLRQEKEAKATAAFFSTPSTGCRRRISFAVDQESSPVTSPGVTSSYVGSGNPCRREGKLGWSTSGRCSPQSGRQNANDLHQRQLKHQCDDATDRKTADYRAMKLREIEEDWNNYLEHCRTKSSGAPRTSMPVC